MQLTINIQDNYAQSFINFLKTLNYINFEQKNINKPISTKDFLKYRGLWSDRDINLINLRQKAWKR